MSTGKLLISLDDIPGPAQVTDQDGVMKAVNQAWVSAMGYPPETVLDCAFHKLLPENEHAHFQELLVSVQRHGGSANAQLRVRTSSGELRLFLLQARTVQPPDQEQPLLLGVLFDATPCEQDRSRVAASEEHLRSILESLPQTIFEADLEGRLLYLNRAGREASGYTDEDIARGINLYDTIAPEDRPRVTENIKQSLARDGSHGNEYTSIRKDGTRMPIKVYSTPILEKGRPVGLRGLILDMESQRKVELALRESEELYATLVCMSPDAITMTDLEGRITFVSEQTLRLHGFDSPLDLIGMNALDLFFPEDRELAFKNMQRTLESGRLGTVEYRMLRGDGSVFMGELNAALVRDPDGKPRAFIATTRDISERKAAEEEHLLMAKALEQAAECVVITDRGAVIRYVNPAFEKTTGYSREESLDRLLLFWARDEDAARLREAMSVLVLRGETWQGRMHSKRHDGSVFEEEATVAPIKDEQGNVTNYIFVSRDMTEELRLERQLRQAQKMEAIGTLAGGIAYDFNNILTAILGYTQLASQEPEMPDDAKRALDSVLTAGIRARELVKQILTFTRQQEQERIPIQLSLILKETVKLLRQTLPTSIRLEEIVRCKSDLVLGEPTQIQQLVMNLATNAAHAMGEQRGLLRIILEEADSLPEEVPPEAAAYEHGYLLLRVQDNGSGISPAIQDRVFEPYFTTKEPGKGTGLGLAVVHGIVKNHKGFIELESRPGQGTSVNVFLPCIQAAPLVGQEPTVPTALGKERILFVDDEQSLAHLGQRLLSRFGYQVEALTDGRQALQLFLEDPDRFDLVITDQTMPELSGTELAKKIFEMRPKLPVILFTGYSEHLDNSLAQRMGISRFLLKPFMADELSRVVREVLDAARPNGPETPASEPAN